MLVYFLIVIGPKIDINILFKTFIKYFLLLQRTDNK